MNERPEDLFRHDAPVGLAANRPTPEYVSDAMAELLGGMDFGHVFLLPGASYRGLHDSLVNHNRNLDPQIVLATSELSAVSMAHGYAKATGKPSLCILHDLVGVMNGSMGLYNAWCDRAPVLFLGGAGPLDPDRRRFIDWVHSASTQSDIVAKWVKWTDEPPTAKAVLESVLRGRKIAATPPQGPVYVSIDSHVQERPLDGDLEIPDPSLPRFAPPAPPAPNAEALARAVAWIVGAEFPVVVGGRLGIRESARAPLIELLEIVGAGGLNDRAVYCWPSDHPQNLSGDGKALLEADVVVCVDVIDVNQVMGAYAVRRRSDRLEARRKPPPRIVDLSLNAAYSNSWTGFGGPTPPVDLQIVCEPEHGLRCLVDAAKTAVDADAGCRGRIAARREALASRHAELRAAQAETARTGWDSSPLKVERMLHEIHEAVKDRPWVLAAANHRSFSEAVWKFPGAGAYLGADGGGGVGYNAPAAVGAALALRREGRFCVAIGGDGDYLMAPGCVWTAVHYGIPLLYVINNNATWGNDEVHQIEVAHARGRPRENAWIGQAMREPAIDFAAVARGFGAWAAGPLSDPGSLAAALREAVREVESGGVAVLDVSTRLGAVS